MEPLAQSRRKRAYLLATGQTTSYVDYDDGYYRKGIVKSYTILTTGQYSGTTNITLNGKTDAHSNNCVVDNNTGLMWSRYASASVGAGSDGKLPWTTNVNGEGIFAFCAAANAAALGGHADWRVPNINELLSLLDHEAALSFPNATAFPSWPNVVMWSSTTTSALTVNAENIIFSYGAMSTAVKTAAAPVALVRG